MPRRHFALLFRGEAWRWGCDAAGKAAQLICTLSYLNHFVKPLEAAEHVVDIFLPMDIRNSSCTHMTQELIGILGGRRQVHVDRFRAVTQGENFRRSLDFFERVQAASASNFTHLVIVRHDVQLLLPVASWSCPRHKLGLASYVDPSFGDNPDEPPLTAAEAPVCGEGINDLMQWVPYRFMAAFSRIIGSANGTDLREYDERGNVLNLTWPACAETCGCFTQGQGPLCEESGHSCYSVAAALLPRQHIGFCWPPAGDPWACPPRLGKMGAKCTGGLPFYTRPVPTWLPSDE